MVLVFNPALQVLRQGMEEAKMTQQELFEVYRDRGGKAKQPNTLGSWLRGERDAPSLQLALLFTCVNERRAAAGLPLIELPFRHGLIEDDNQPKLEVVEGRRKFESHATPKHPKVNPSVQQQTLSPAA